MLQKTVWALSNIQRHLHCVSAVLSKVTRGSNHHRCSVKKVFLEMLKHFFTGKHLCNRVSFLIKLKAFLEHLRTTASKVSIRFKS